MARNVSVYLCAGRWSVRRSGARRALRRYERRSAAIAAATELAERDRAVVYIHGRDGRIAERRAFA